MTSNPEIKKKGKVFRRILKVFGYIVIFLIIALLVFVLISMATNHTVFIFGKTTAWVLTPSMEPTIPARSYILIEKVSPDDVTVGDIIIFKSDDPALDFAFNTHRVTQIIGDNDEFVTQGDANPVEDQYTAKADNVLGRYVKNLPVLTAIGRFLFSSIGTLIAITMIFAIMLIMYMPGLIRAGRRKTAEIERRRAEQFDALVREEVERLKAEDAAKTNGENADVDSNQVSNDISDEGSEEDQQPKSL